MEPNIINKMEEFIEKAEATLTAVNRATNLLKWLFAGILAITLVMVVDTRIEVVNKADASDVLFKHNALVIEKLRLDNSARKFAIFADSTSDMDLVEKYDENYLWQVEGIYDIKYTGVK